MALESIIFLGLFYASYQYDNESGFYYLKSRYYIPFMGRFLTKDVVSGHNLYVYCENNPVNRVDPNGNISISVMAATVILDIVLLALVPYIAGSLAGLKASYLLRWAAWWKKGVEAVAKGIAKSIYSIIEEFTYAIRGRVVHVAFKGATISRLTDIISSVISLSPGGIIAVILDAIDKDGWNGKITF